MSEKKVQKFYTEEFKRQQGGNEGIEIQPQRKTPETRNRSQSWHGVLGQQINPTEFLWK